jgi:predicted RNA-binding Zn-ribbon protein involved in translation (DUF1610 family)
MKSDPHHRYACSTCGRERSVRRKATRIRYPCPDCEEIRSFERLGRVTPTH